jgi:hypothetical protein
MVRSEGFEPPAFWFVANRRPLGEGSPNSLQINYLTDSKEFRVVGVRKA